MFYNYNSLRSIYLTDFRLGKIKNMSGNFYNCSSLEIIKLNNYADEIIDINSMFNNCISVKLIEFSNLRTNNVKNMSMMFNNCLSLINALL